MASAADRESQGAGAQVFARGWPQLMAGSAVAVAFGFLGYLRPHLAAALYLGLFAAGAAVLAAHALARAREVRTGRILRVLAAGVDLAAIVAVALHPLRAGGMIWLTGVWAVVRGVVAIAVGLADLSAGRRTLRSVAAGALLLGFGAMLVSQHGVHAHALIRLVASWALLLGVAALGVAVNLRRAARLSRDRLGAVEPSEARRSSAPATPGDADARSP
jgi:hypothetical protein